MHVLINAPSAHMGGGYTYLRNLVEWLPRSAPSDQFTICVPSHTMHRLLDVEAPNVSYFRYPGSNTGGPRRVIFDQVQVPVLADRWNVDALFSATGFGTFVSRCPEVLLVRNAQFFSEDFYAVYRKLGRSLAEVRFRRWYSEMSIRAADVVTFPTRSMMEMVSEYVTMRAKKAFPLHYGFDREHFFNGTEEPYPEIEAVRRCTREAELTLLNVSTYAVHKNLEVLVEALGHLPENLRNRIRLITTTSREQTTDTAEYDALKRRAEKLDVSDIWLELGYVDYSHLDQIYSLADVYAFPSFTESFGHSMVEAMASGLPVLAADTDVNREILGEVGTYFPPHDSRRCAALVEEVMRGSPEVARAGTLAVGRSQKFSWKSYVDELVDVFHSLQ